MARSHAGGAFRLPIGGLAMLWFFPFDRTAVVAMCNLEGVQWQELLGALSTAALG